MGGGTTKRRWGKGRRKGGEDGGTQQIPRLEKSPGELHVMRGANEWFKQWLNKSGMLVMREMPGRVRKHRGQRREEERVSVSEISPIPPLLQRRRAQREFEGPQELRSSHAHRPRTEELKSCPQAGSVPQLHSSMITDSERFLVGWDTYPFRDRASLVLRQQEPVSVATAARFSSAHRSTASTGLKMTVKPYNRCRSTQQR